MGEQTAGDPDGAAAIATRHREHRFPGRQRAVQVRFSEPEFAAIELAAGHAGLTPTGHVGAVTLATARGTATRRRRGPSKRWRSGWPPGRRCAGSAGT